MDLNRLSRIQDSKQDSKKLSDLRQDFVDHFKEQPRDAKFEDALKTLEDAYDTKISDEDIELYKKVFEAEKKKIGDSGPLNVQSDDWELPEKGQVVNLVYKGGNVKVRPRKIEKDGWVNDYRIDAEIKGKKVTFTYNPEFGEELHTTLDAYLKRVKDSTDTNN